MFEEAYDGAADAAPETDVESNHMDSGYQGDGVTAEDPVDGSPDVDDNDMSQYESGGGGSDAPQPQEAGGRGDMQQPQEAGHSDTQPEEGGSETGDPDEGGGGGGEEDPDAPPLWGADAELTLDGRGAVNLAARAVRWAVDGRFAPDGIQRVNWNGEGDTMAERDERIERRQERQEQAQEAYDAEHPVEALVRRIRNR